MFKNFPMVSRVVFGKGCFAQLDDILAGARKNPGRGMIFLIDHAFENTGFDSGVPVRDRDHLIWADVSHEPTTQQVDELTARSRELCGGEPDGVVGIGGGSVMDLAKAVAIMLTNAGSSSEYQGWDLVKNPSAYHAGVPTLSGTGAEVSRTTVLLGPKMKLGLNSDYTVFDQIVLDPELIAGAPNPQRFYTGMDCYIHCVESLQGNFKNTFSEAYAQKALELCQHVFLHDHEPADADEMLMMASYCGGMSIANSQVGVCHAMSYGLGFVLGVRHGVGNCIVFDQLDEFYGEGVNEFRRMTDRHQIDLPRQVTANVTDEQMQTMIDVALRMEPLWENALGPDWKSEMTRARLEALYARM